MVEKMNPSNDKLVSRSDDFDNYSETYEAEIETAFPFSSIKLDYVTRVKCALLFDLFENVGLDLKSLKLLDVGCGIGAYHNRLKKRISNIVGLDVSLKSIEQAERLNPECHYQSYNGKELPFASNLFDVVTIMCVLHHITPEGWQQIICECRRVLKRGGIVVIVEHNPLNPLTRKIVDNCEFDKDAVLLNKNTSINLVSKAKFLEIKSHTIFNIPSWSRLTRRLDRLIGRLPFGAQYFVIGRK